MCLKSLNLFGVDCLPGKPHNRGMPNSIVVEFHVYTNKSDPTLMAIEAWTQPELETGLDGPVGQRYKELRALTDIDHSPIDGFELIVDVGGDREEMTDTEGATPLRCDDDDWRREIAMEAGMLGGCEAYNEVMGY